jgi:dTDP-4-amino-4,6-dideoxygalactose transaminase
MRITKGAVDSSNCRRSFVYFNSARAAFKTFLAAQDLSRDECVLLPAYIGWSPREGSGVFDPLRELGLSYRFYRVDANLNIDLEEFERGLNAGRVRVAVLIHYFGRVDPNARQAGRLARQVGAQVVEDSAHALLTDLVSGVAGSIGDASIFSLHKLLPIDGGGMLVKNGCALEESPPAEEMPRSSGPWHFDLHSIARRRQFNAAFLDSALRALDADVQPLWSPDATDFVPQTYPVLIRRADRDAVYREMNYRGFGVVSLYHTLIDEIDRREFAVSHSISKRILNLPVHQDVMPEALEAFVTELKDVLCTSNTAA